MEEEEDYSNGATATATSNNKNRKISPLADSDTDIGSDFAFFDELTDDLVLEIISKLGSTASCPAHFFNLLLTSKRMNELGFHRTVLKNVSPKVFTSRAQNWEVDALEFIKKCVEAMNVEAIYTLGMNNIGDALSLFWLPGSKLAEVEMSALMFYFRDQKSRTRLIPAELASLTRMLVELLVVGDNTKLEGH